MFLPLESGQRLPESGSGEAACVVKMMFSSEVEVDVMVTARVGMMTAVRTAVIVVSDFIVKADRIGGKQVVSG
jgi:hypothetical protein